MNVKYKLRLWIWAAFLNLFIRSSFSQDEMNSTAKSLSTTDDESIFRLPTSLNPLHYLIRLQPFVNGNFSIHGYTEITFEVVQPTSNIILHIRDILTKNETLKIYSVSDANQTRLPVSNQTYDKEREFYIISLSDSLKDGESYIMRLQFVGFMSDKLKGFYRSHYRDREAKKRWLAVTHFQPTYARMAFPCFDEPAMKAEFSIELIREEGMSSISNMPRVETIPVAHQNGWFVDKFERSVKMSTYLVAFMISDFKYSSISTPNDTTVLGVWAKEEAINQTEYALQKGLEALLFFEKFFNISFPLPKLDMLAIPDFPVGGMENWGLITYSESLLLYYPNQSSFNNKQNTGSIIAHELAHQWFGNLVTPYWWTDLWLNEGFATYMAVLAYDAIEPTFQIMKKFVKGGLQVALLLDALENSHPISIPVGHPDEISEIFDSISYSKGASLIRMMNHFLTENTFKKGITNYLNEFAYSDAKQDDLWYYLTLQAEADQILPSNVTVKEIMDTWTLQMGFPVINVILHRNGTATLTQERFLVIKSENFTDNHDYKWWVPVTFATQSNPNFSMTYPQEWLEPSEATKTIHGMPLNHDWVVFNLLQTGFYRVNYELENWYKLIQQFNKNHSVINTLNRVQIIGDSFQLARAGLLPYSIPLGLISYLSKEAEYVPLSSAVSHVLYLLVVVKYTEHSDTFNSFLLSLLAPHYVELGFEESLQDHFVDQEKRSLIAPEVCYLEYKPCLDNTMGLYQEWMLNPQNESIISPNMRAVVYSNGIREGGNKEWDFAWNQYLNSDIASEKHKLLSALGCTRNITKKINLIKLAFDPDGPIRKQDSSSAFYAVLRDRKSLLMAWNYLKENWERIYKYLGSKSRAIGLLNSATRYITTYEELGERDQFIASKKELQGVGTRSLQQSREGIVTKIKWLQNNLDSVIQWLKDNGFGNKEAGASTISL